MNQFNEELKCCITCESKDISLWQERPSRGIGFEVTMFTLFKCANCGLIFINPRPTRELLETIYSRSGHSLKEPISLETVFELEKEYPNSTIDSERVIKTAKKLLKNNKNVGKFEVLDIGSGYGFYSQAALAEGYKVMAINPSIWENNIFEKINGFRPIQSFFEDVKFEKKFDLVMLNQVLEHIDDPKLFLGKIHEILSDDGIIIIAVPNLNSYLVKMGYDGGVFWIPEHLNCFTKKSLNELFRNTGFSVSKMEGISRYPYFAISNKLGLTGFKRKLCNTTLKYAQYFPLKFFNLIGWSGIFNVYIRKK